MPTCQFQVSLLGVTMLTTLLDASTSSWTMSKEPNYANFGLRWIIMNGSNASRASLSRLRIWSGWTFLCTEVSTCKTHQRRTQKLTFQLIETSVSALAASRPTGIASLAKADIMIM